MSEKIFNVLESIHNKPKAFEFYTAAELWTDEYTSEQMLSYHLNEDVDLSSRNHALIDKSVNWMIQNLAIGDKTTIADFGCGPGLYAQKLARAGAHVTGIDFSPRSIAYAREVAEKEGLDIEYINENYLEFETDKKFDLIIMIFCDYCVLSPDQRKKLLSIFSDIMKDGASLLMDVSSSNAYEKKSEQVLCEKNMLNNFWSAEDYYCFLATHKYEKEQVTLDKYTVIEKNRIREVYNWLHYFTVDSLQTEFSNSGFQIDKTFANVAGDPFDPERDEFAVVASKKAE